MARKKRRAPNAFQKGIVKFCLWLARCCIEYANMFAVDDKDSPVSQKMIKYAQKKWTWRKQQTLAILKGVYKRHALLDRFESLDDESQDKHKKVIMSVRDIIFTIDAIRRRYDEILSICQTREAFEACNYNFECAISSMYGDVMDQIDAYQECIERKKASMEFVIEVEACLKDVQSFCRYKIISDDSVSVIRLKALLRGIVKQWKHIEGDSDGSSLVVFHCNIGRRRLLINRLWEQAVPQSCFCFEEYNPAYDVWYPEPYDNTKTMYHDNQ